MTIDVFPQGRGRNAIAAAVQEERSAGPELATEVQADTAGDTQAVNLSQVEIVPEKKREMRLIEGSEDALMPPPPAPAVVPATASRPAPGKKTAQKKDPSVLVTLAHGDALVLAGCDFEVRSSFRIRGAHRSEVLTPRDTGEYREEGYDYEWVQVSSASLDID